MMSFKVTSLIYSFLPLGATAQGELWPPEQSASILLYSSTWRTRVSLFAWLLPLDLAGMGDPTSSYATAGIALRVSGALKIHHHDKVETPSVGTSPINKLRPWCILSG
jgi:hypothetical protein